jgi:hypothetical protein
MSLAMTGIRLILMSLGLQVLYSIPAWRLAGQTPAAAFWESGTSGAAGPCQLIMQLVGSCALFASGGGRDISAGALQYCCFVTGRTATWCSTMFMGSPSIIGE